MKKFVCVLGLVLSCATPSWSDEPMSGTFEATQACAAYQSIRKGTNPGGVMVDPNRSYQILAKNKADATHYRIVVDGAAPRERWVSVACGTVAGGPAGTSARSAGQPGAAGSSGARATHVLALSWQPAFCAAHRDKTECRSPSEAAGRHLSLHGLWPQPRGNQYCNVPQAVQQIDRRHDWDALPEPDISYGTLKRLSAVMPGVQSRLQRHEWIVHGTCFGGNADAYFARAAGLAEEVNASKVSQLFASNSGRSISADDIRSAFDADFGKGAGERVLVSCSGRGGERKITELKLNLAGDVPGKMGLGDLMRAAQPVEAGCPSGYVTPSH